MMKANEALEVEFYGGDGHWRWRLRTANNRIIGASTETYVQRGKAMQNFSAVTGLICEFDIPRLGPFKVAFRSGAPRLLV